MRPRKKEPRVAFAIRVDREIYSRISQLADEKESTKSAVGEKLLRRALRMKDKVHVIQSVDPELVREWKAVGRNLNQLSKVANSEKSIAGVVDQLDDVIRRLEDLL